MRSGSSGSLRWIRDLFLMISLSLLMCYVIAWAAEEKQPVQLVEINPIGGSYISTTPEFTLAFDKNVANVEVREHNKGQILFQDNSGNEIMIRVSIADDKIYPNQKREIRVRVLEALSPGNYRLIVKAGIRAKNGTETRKSSTYYYRVKAAAPPAEPVEPETESAEETTEAPPEKVTEAPETSTEKGTEVQEEPEESMEEPSLEENPSLGDSEGNGKEPSGEAAGPGLREEEKVPSAGESVENPEKLVERPTGSNSRDKITDRDKEEISESTTTASKEAESAKEDIPEKVSEEENESIETEEDSTEEKQENLNSLNLKGISSQNGDSEGGNSLILYSIELTDSMGEELELNPYELEAADGEGESPASRGGKWPAAAIGGFLISSLGCAWRVLKFYRDIR